MADEATTATMGTPSRGETPVIRVQRIVITSPDGQVAQLGWFNKELCLVVNAGPTTEAGTAWRSIDKTKASSRLRFVMGGTPRSYLADGSASFGAGNITWRDQYVQHGIIGAGGTIVQRKGSWTVSNGGVGINTVSFNPAFAAGTLPTILVGHSREDADIVIFFDTLLTTSVRFTTRTFPGNAAVDARFHFAAIGAVA